MAETSPGWNVDYEIIPGAHRLRGIVRNITSRVCFLPPSEGYPSEYPKHPERRVEPQQLPLPGEIGAVPTKATLLAEANAIIN